MTVDTRSLAMPLNRFKAMGTTQSRKPIRLLSHHRPEEIRNASALVSQKVNSPEFGFINQVVEERLLNARNQDFFNQALVLIRSDSKEITTCG